MTIALSILIVILLLYIIYVRRKTKQDIDEFAESIINRDFSRKSPRFQSITDAFLNLAAEKEAQQHYLKEMLELMGIYKQGRYPIQWKFSRFYECNSS